VTLILVLASEWMTYPFLRNMTPCKWVDSLWTVRPLERSDHYIVTPNTQWRTVWPISKDTTTGWNGVPLDNDQVCRSKRKVCRRTLRFPSTKLYKLRQLQQKRGIKGVWSSILRTHSHEFELHYRHRIKNASFVFWCRTQAYRYIEKPVDGWIYIQVLLKIPKDS
jgi:hypothetical protein